VAVMYVNEIFTFDSIEDLRLSSPNLSGQFEIVVVGGIVRQSSIEVKPLILSLLGPSNPKAHIFLLTKGKAHSR
ncbi:MAG TPA: hypothetical protein VKV15_00210, partial [Bryobacteraceae bacterium]|nr:hypothetical protein [Bryobacteraceae bacterium]